MIRRSHPSYLTQESITSFIESALNEDIGEGDHTSLATVPQDSTTRVQLMVKDSGILAGVSLAQQVIAFVDPTVKMDILLEDGSVIKPGDVAFIAEGPARVILSTERLILNCMQRMSGIATQTHKLCQLLEGTKVRLMDTRKTTPNFRLMEKWAVAIGGGINHRFGLYDKIMIKDNHVDIAGGVGQAIARVHAYLKKTGKHLDIEVETRTMREVEHALEAGGVDIIMLDNMGIDEMKEAVKRIGDTCKTEASGGITEKNIRAVAASGVDFISMGALTHTVRSIDLSLKVVR
ncbi:MAG: carboxylating nicotinate-nucleotide diphosphorylase [Cyclobacteriaceae bacterium]|nr:carboxylating nicotinate-nucleotide diphosphorylase [Cyclobacteriaceae bacterium]